MLFLHYILFFIHFICLFLTLFVEEYKVVNKFLREKYKQSFVNKILKFKDSEDFIFFYELIVSLDE